MRMTVVCCFLPIFVAGCFLGDPAAHRGVSLQLSVPGNIGFVGDEPEVQEALRIVDGALINYGLSRDPNRPAPNEQHVIAVYDIWSATDQKMVFAGPTVSLSDDRLSFDFIEFPARHSSPHVKKICSDIADRLSSRYGDKKVKIED